MIGTAPTTAETPALSDLLDRGWEPVGDSRLYHPILHRYRPVPLDIRRVQVEVAELRPDPVVVPIEISGRRPTAQQVQVIEQALTKIPAGVIRRWREAGGRIEVVAGNNASIHPAFFIGSRSLGWCAPSGKLIAIAADGERVERTTLHEFGHALDYTFGHVSNNTRWSEGFYCLYGQEHRWRDEPAATSYEGSSPAEFFAGVFASYFGSEYRRRCLHDDLRRFIAQAAEQFAEKP